VVVVVVVVMVTLVLDTSHMDATEQWYVLSFIFHIMQY